MSGIMFGGADGAGGAGAGAGSKNIFKNHAFSVTRKGFSSNKKTRYEVHFRKPKNSSDMLSKVVGMLLLGEEITGRRVVEFNSVEPLRAFLKRTSGANYALKCIDMIIRQYRMLGIYSKTMNSISLDNVFVFDNSKFVFLGDRKSVDDYDSGIVDVLENERIVLRDDLDGDDAEDDGKFKTVHKNHCHAAFGDLIVSIIFGEHTDDLAPIIGTKLYYFIRRCYDDDPEMRVLVWV
jgi:hypothetical protein